MARCYNAAMPMRQPALPRLWLLSDRRNDAMLEAALARLPPGSGFIFRHAHLCPAERRARFRALCAIARRRRHLVVLAGDAALARRWGADGAYGSPRRQARGPALLRLAAVHDLAEIGAARRAHALLLSPVFATRSHPRARLLGVQRFLALAARAQVPVIALGGMDAQRARRLGGVGWAAIDALGLVG
ncbi:MAG: thiamine phosphate synthase [Sphingomonadales bacterium]|nr:thiamine phosphate synthase [Sphingomonadales bacterium]